MKTIVIIVIGKTGLCVIVLWHFLIKVHTIGYCYYHGLIQTTFFLNLHVVLFNSEKIVLFPVMFIIKSCMLQGRKDSK